MLDERTQHANCLLKALEDEFAAGLASEQGWSARRTALDMHLRSMGVTRVLTRNEEAHLFAIFNRVCEYDLSRTEKPTAEAVQAASEAHGVSTAILSTYVSQSQRARSLLLRFNMRLVLATAKRFLVQARMNGVPFEDLIPEGRQGLMTAMLKFEPERGFKFSSYSVWHIRQRVQRCIQKESRVVYVPAHVQENLPRVLNATAKLQEMRGEGAVVTDQDIADVLGMRASKVKTIRQSMQPMVFLDDLLYAGSGAKGEQSEASYMEIISDDSAEVAHEDEQQDKAIQECLNAVLQTLHPRERNILRLRYGLNTERRKVSRLEIADAYGLSHERIRQIEDEAVRKLMVPWRRQVLEERSAGAL